MGTPCRQGLNQRPSFFAKCSLERMANGSSARFEDAKFIVGKCRPRLANGVLRKPGGFLVKKPQPEQLTTQPTARILGSAPVNAQANPYVTLIIYRDTSTFELLKFISQVCKLCRTNYIFPALSLSSSSTLHAPVHATDTGLC